MAIPSSFTNSVSEIARGLRDGPPSFFHLNRAAGQIDHLGRLLHGLSFIRDREIAACFTAAIHELHESIELPETARLETIERAVRQLETSLVYLDQGATG
jgi:hypothetical protein